MLGGAPDPDGSGGGGSARAVALLAASRRIAAKDGANRDCMGGSVHGAESDVTSGGDCLLPAKVACHGLRRAVPSRPSRMALRVPIGIDDFRKLREQGLEYVD